MDLVMASNGGYNVNADDLTLGNGTENSHPLLLPNGLAVYISFYSS
jgi:hypothetical protein